MGKTILIVDDAAFMRMMIRDILTKNGYEVVRLSMEEGLLKNTRNYCRIW